MTIEVTDPAGREIQARITAAREHLAAHTALGANLTLLGSYAQIVKQEETNLVQHLLARGQITNAQILETL